MKTLKKKKNYCNIDKRVFDRDLYDFSSSWPTPENMYKISCSLCIVTHVTIHGIEMVNI